MSYNIRNGYNIRADLKAVGATYYPASKDWEISDEAFAKLNATSQAHVLAHGMHESRSVPSNGAEG
ncbi:MAG: hypothetical protein ACYCZD_12730 [Rhodanobacter sp.]